MRYPRKFPFWFSNQLSERRLQKTMLFVVSHSNFPLSSFKIFACVIIEKCVRTWFSFWLEATKKLTIQFCWLKPYAWGPLLWVFYHLNNLWKMKNGSEVFISVPFAFLTQCCHEKLSNSHKKYLYFDEIISKTCY